MQWPHVLTFDFKEYFHKRYHNLKEDFGDFSKLE